MHSLGSGLQLAERPDRTGASINHHTEGNQMPRNKHDLKVVDNGDEDGGRKSRGPAVNRVILVGRRAGDPELRYTPSGSAVTQLRLVTNEGEESEFHQLSAWGKVAEFADNYLKKGRLVYVEAACIGRAGSPRTAARGAAARSELATRPATPAIASNQKTRAK
jgi:hypothetical protein